MDLGLEQQHLEQHRRDAVPNPPAGDLRADDVDVQRPRDDGRFGMTGATARWRALGTDVHVIVDGGDLEVATAAVTQVLVDVDRTYSRFRADSELSQLNERAEAPTVSPLLARAIEAALRGARATDGLVDPTVGRAMRAIGYDEDFAVIGHRHSGPTTIPTRPPMRKMTTNPTTAAIHPGTIPLSKLRGATQRPSSPRTPSS